MVDDPCAPNYHGLVNYPPHAPTCHGLVDDPNALSLCSGLVDDPHVLYSCRGLGDDPLVIAGMGNAPHIFNTWLMTTWGMMMLMPLLNQDSQDHIYICICTLLQFPAIMKLKHLSFLLNYLLIPLLCCC
jgi:hypothetical protein